MGRASGKNRRKTLGKMSKWLREKGGVEDQECDGRTVLREIWKEWEEYGEQQHQMGDGDW